MLQGGPFLDQPTIDMIRQWIAEGALDNQHAGPDYSKSTASPVPGAL